MKVFGLVGGVRSSGRRRWFVRSETGWCREGVGAVGGCDMHREEMMVVVVVGGVVGVVGDSVYTSKSGGEGR